MKINMVKLIKNKIVSNYKIIAKDKLTAEEYEYLNNAENMNEEMENYYIAVRLRELRLSCEMSQTELAKECKFDVTYIRRLENGEAKAKNTSVDTILKIATALNTSVELLMTGSHNMDIEDAVRMFQEVGSQIKTYFDDYYNATMYVAMYEGQKISLKYPTKNCNTTTTIKRTDANKIIDVIKKYNPLKNDIVIFDLENEGYLGTYAAHWGQIVRNRPEHLALITEILKKEDFEKKYIKYENEYFYDMVELR